MFTDIEIRNFGAFPANGQHVPLGNITYIVGPNNSGKSTILSAFLSLATIPLRHGAQLPAVNSVKPTSAGGNFVTPFFGPQAFSRNDELYEFLKFQNGSDATFAKKRDDSMFFGLSGAFSDGNAKFGLFLRGYPDFRSFNLVLDGSEEACKSLYSALANTWVFPSNRTFAGPSLQVGTRNANNLGFGQSGSNMIQFLLEKYTSRDSRWESAEEWLRKIDPNVELLKSPLRGLFASVETTIKLQDESFDINITQSGSGIQRALQIICAIVFSENNSVIIIEEPEMNLHPSAQEVLVDLFNTAANEWRKQIIITTHSWDMILEIYSDIGLQSKGRGSSHVRTNGENFRMAKLSSQNGKAEVESYDMAKKTFDQLKSDFKRLWG